MNVLEARALGKRFGRRFWALHDCGLAVPEGHVAALVGPNGAGKTTLLKLAVGLLRPTRGEARVLGGHRPGTAPALAGTGFVAQHVPLYRDLSVNDTLHMARNMNRSWDQPGAVARLAGLGIPLNRKVGRLSGGQRAQVALTLALAKRPRLLLLDEPMAALDPLARHDFLGMLMAAVSEDGLSVVFSSHVLAELERVADYLIVLNRGQVQLAGTVEDLLARHRILTGPAAEKEQATKRLRVVHVTGNQTQAQVLARSASPGEGPPEGWESSPATLEELVLGYLREPGATALPGPAPLQPADSPAAQA